MLKRHDSAGAPGANFYADERARGVVYLHRYAVLTACWILGLIFLGGQVKSTESGLSVPDWPNTYGHFMFSFPWEQMVGGIFWEHLHRMVASVAGLLTFGLTIWIYRVDRRSWVRQLSLWASIAVLVQGALGGLTVLNYLPAWLSASHGTLAQAYLCMVVVVALATAKSWRNDPAPLAEPGGASLRTLVLATTVVIFLQLIIGALMRHSEAGLAIPDVPTMFGGWAPPLSDAQLAAANQELMKLDLPRVTRWQMIAHLLHRLGALAATTMIIWTGVRTLRASRGLRELRRPVWLLLALLVAQVTLGILTILTEKKQFTIASLHVVTGAATLATSLVLAVRVRRRFASRAAEPVRPAVSTGIPSAGAREVRA